MSEVSNPYRQWLGLESSGDDPDHYALLSLDRQEQDSDRIAAAADRAIARVRSCRPGQQAAQWAALLDRLELAKRCLCDPQQRAEYDRQLDEKSTRTGSSTGDSAEWEVAPVNMSPDLYPPGMAPPGAERSPAGDRPHGRTASNPGDGSHRAPGDSHAAKLDPMEPVPTAAPVHDGLMTSPRRDKGSVPAPVSTGTAGDRRRPATRSPDAAPKPPGAPAPESDEPLDSRPPINAHVGPPPSDKNSLLPVMVGVTTVLVIVMLALICVAMYDPARPSPPGADPGSVGNSAGGSSSPAGLGGPLGPAGTGLAPSNSPTRQTVPAVQPAPSAGADATGGIAADGSNGNAMPADNSNAEPATDAGSGPQAGGALFGGAQTTDNEHDVPDTPADTTSEESQVDRLVDAAREALGTRDFTSAEKQLREAGALATAGPHKARVAGWLSVSQNARQFWQVVQRQMMQFRGAEEIPVGDRGLVVLVVESQADSIVIRRNGKNERYTLAEMPIGLAVALFKFQGRGSDPSMMVIAGSALLAVRPSKPNYVSEANELWTQAKGQGARVDLLLPLLKEATPQ